MPTEKQRLIFISYSRTNRGFALELAKELKASGFLVWFDQLDIPTGARWDDEIEKALTDCEIFMVIMTPESIASHNVKDEIGYAIDSNKRILPILLEQANVPFRMRRFQYVDFTNKSNNEGIDAAKQLLRKLLDDISEPEVVSQPTPAIQQPEVDRQSVQKSDPNLLAQRRAEAIRKARQQEPQARSVQPAPQTPSIDRKPAQQQEQKQPARSSFSLIGIAALIGVLCLGSGYAIWAVVNTTPLPVPTTAVPTTVTPPTPGVITELPPVITPPTPVPPGSDSELAFVSDRGQAVGDFQVFVIDPDNPDPTSYQPFSVNPTGYERVYWPSFCGDQIAVEANDKNKNGMVQWIYFLDHSSAPSKGELGGGDILGQPRCSPDGNFLAYSAHNQDGWRSLVVADRSSKTFSSYPQNSTVGRASWSQSMESILFPVSISNDNKSWAFHIMESFGSRLNETPVLNLTGASPSISPDGQQIAYHCPDNGDGFLCVADISGGSPRLLAATDTSHNSDFFKDPGVYVSSVTPVWSSDGQWIYYLDYDGGDYDIFRIHPDGSGRENVTRDWPSNELMPATR